MAQQTAVEWLENQLEVSMGVYFPTKLYKPAYELFEQAKAMEKEQIILAHNHGEYFSQFRNLDDENGKQYYNETYNK